MGRKHRHHRKRKYYSVTDRLSFKVIGSIFTALLYTVLYFLIVILMERPELALVCSIPCVIMLIWVALKQRYFWWVWMLVACPCIVMLAVLSQPMISWVIQTVYWAVTYGMCQWLICADSKPKHMAKLKRPTRRHHRSSDQPVAPRPKDEFLEALLGDAE